VKGTSIPTQINASLNGGLKGIFLNNGDPWGTTDGQTGTSLSGLSVSFPTDTFRTPAVNLGNDTLLCPGDTIRLNAANSGNTYLYSTGATTQTTVITTGGTYSVAVSAGSFCVVRDTIIISTGVNPIVRLGNDTAICPGATITLNGGISGSGFSYLYSNSAVTPTTNVTNAGIYTLRVTNLTTGCRGRDTIVLSQGQNPTVNLGRDTAVCPGKSLTLDAGNPGSTYLYSTSATTRLINVTAAGTYSVRVTNASKCVGRDTIVIAQGVDPVVNLGNDTAVCADSAITVDAGNPGSTYLYSTGATTRTHSLIPAGMYTVQVTNAQGCIGRDTINVTVIPKPVVSSLSTKRSGASFSFGSNAQHVGTYQWSFGDNTTSGLDSPSHTYTANGSYTVRLIVFNSCGSDTATMNVAIEGLSTGTLSIASGMFRIYPNPASSSVTIDNKSTFTMQSVTVINSVGTVVLRRDGIDPKQQILDISSLASGIYLIRVQTDGGSIQQKLQILK
jgi:PKD repeat protein